MKVNSVESRMDDPSISIEYQIEQKDLVVVKVGKFKL